MPYKSMENAPVSWKKLEDVALTLEQINWIANVYDGLKPKEEKGEIESAAAVAIQRFKDTHKIENDKWVKKMKETDEEEEYLDPEKKKYPCDKKNLMSTMEKFNKPGKMTEDGYSKSEWRKMGKMLSEKMGDEYKFDEDKMKVMRKKMMKESVKFKEAGGLFLESEDAEGKEWDVVLIAEGKSSNKGTHGLPRYYPKETLKKSVENKIFSKGPVKLYQFGQTGGLYDHVPSNVLESHPDGVFGNQVGWIDDEKYGEFIDEKGQKREGVLGRFHVMEGFEWLRKALKDMWDNGKTILGFSIDGEGDENPRYVNGKTVDYVDMLNSISENTLVSNPAAGGGMLRLVASVDNQNKDTEMNLVELFKLIEELKPKLLEGKDRSKLTEADVLAMLREAMQTEQTVTPPAVSPPVITPFPVIDPKTVEQIQTAVAQLTESVKISAKNQQLTSRLTESNLPNEFKNDLSRRYSNKDWKEEDLNADIKAEQDKAAKFQESHPVYGQSFQINATEKDKLQLAMDGLFEGKDMKDKDGKFVPRFVSFKEAYANVVGDPRAAYASANTIVADSYFYQPDNLSSDTARLTESYDRERRKRMRESIMREAIGMQTSDWAQILGDSVTRKMQKEAENPQLNLWRKLCSDIVPVNDFRTQRRLKVGGYGILSTVAERGTYPSLTSPTDDEATYAAAKKGGTDDLTIEMIANDDVGAIRRIPTKLGRSAAQTIYRDVFGLLKNNLEQDGSTTLASSARANYGTTALSTAGYQALRTLMRSLTKYGDSYEELGIANIPRILVVPNELEDTALRVKNSDIAVSAIYTAGTSHYNTQTEPNVYKSDITDVIVCDFWTDTNNWWGIADPALVPTIEVGFYQGRETPELFVQDQPNVGSVFTADKITYKVRYIYGFAVLEYRSFGFMEVT